ncbi:MAG: GCN5-related N-acetyltransferase [Rhizobacter sp.]|jgi:amino-acid N-acetyltransferase|nr:GCN5-related N-acetyltransferase [Rhizobacter sp.]
MSNSKLFDSWTLMPDGSLIRSAGEEDVNDIVRVLRLQGGEVSLYHVGPGDILQRIHEFLIASDAQGETIGCAAVRAVSAEVAELASLAVAPGSCGRDIGPTLIHECLQLAAARGFTRAWLATRRPGYFKRIGFSAFSFYSLPLSVQLRKFAAVLRQPIGRWRYAVDGGFVFLEREVTGLFGLVRDRGAVCVAARAGASEGVRHRLTG